MHCACKSKSMTQAIYDNTVYGIRTLWKDCNLWWCNGTMNCFHHALELLRLYTHNLHVHNKFLSPLCKVWQIALLPQSLTWATGCTVGVEWMLAEGQRSRNSAGRLRPCSPGCLVGESLCHGTASKCASTEWRATADKAKTVNLQHKARSHSFSLSSSHEAIHRPMGQWEVYVSLQGLAGPQLESCTIHCFPLKQYMLACKALPVHS
jgi:hypothetical protein